MFSTTQTSLTILEAVMNTTAWQAITVGTVPEPSQVAALTLLVPGIAGFVIARRRKGLDA